MNFFIKNKNKIYDQYTFPSKSIYAFSIQSTTSKEVKIISSKKKNWLRLNLLIFANFPFWYI